MNDTEFQKRLWLSSVPLVQLNEQYLPIDMTSGCLVDYAGKRLLLTVSHATGNQGNWAIQLRYVPGKNTEIYQLGAMNFLAKGSLSTPKLDDIDFSYVEVPSNLCSYRQEIEAILGEVVVKSETPIIVHSPSLEDIPKSEDKFGFCGIVMPEGEEHFGQIYLGGEFRVCSNLSFLRTEDDYHVFSLPFPHPGHKYFKGCSGAPILSSSGSLVALVTGGCEKTNEIWGISVREYKTPIDFLVGNVG